MKYIVLILVLFGLSDVASGQVKVRVPKDSVGFAVHSWQMDSVIIRLSRKYSGTYDSLGIGLSSKNPAPARFAICPHDDYAYAGWLYPVALGNIQAKTVIILGVSHYAKAEGVENLLVFDDYSAWKSPGGDVPVNKDLRTFLLKSLPKNSAGINHKLHKEEHSIEALVPFLKAFNPGVEIVPVLVPFMSFGRMDTISAQFADLLADYLTAKGLVWGKDVAIVVSNDAVHYGDQDWGGKDYSLYGTDTAAFVRVLEQEDKIINHCLLPGPEKQRALDLMNNLVFEENPRVYKWTWCGRYSVPFALLLVSNLATITAQPIGEAEVSLYSTSISRPVLNVADLGMGVTAPANLRHWVGYVAMFWK